MGQGAVALKRLIMRIITIALLTTLATLAPAQAQNVRFHDRAGRVTGSARTDANGVTTFHDRAGRVTGRSRPVAGAHQRIDVVAEQLKLPVKRARRAVNGVRR